MGITNHMLIGVGVFAAALALVIGVGFLASQSAVLWLGSGLLAIGALLTVGGLRWPIADRHWDAQDEMFSDRLGPIHVSLFGSLVAAVGAVVALLGAIAW